MPEHLNDRWNTRDRPVLLEIARRLDEGEPTVDSRAVGLEMGIEQRDAAAACVALTPEYLVGHAQKVAGGAVYMFTVEQLTSRGRREVGLWPSGEGVDALVDALRQAEDLTDDPEEKGLIRRAAGAVGSVSRDVMVDVMGAVIARQSGLG